MTKPGNGPRMTFHIGAHKTGTSVLQSVLAANRQRLRDRRVVYLGRPLLDGFAKNAADRDPHSGPLAVRLAEVAARGDTDVVIGSCENVIGPPFTRDSTALYPLAGSRARALRAVLDTYDATIVVSIRPQSEFLESYYLQTINQGGYDTFGQWLGRRDLEQLSWLPVLDAIRTGFAGKPVRVLDFRLLRDRGPQAYLDEFLGLCGTGTGIEISGPERDNASLSARGLQIALAINPLIEGKSEQTATRKFLQENFSNRSFPRPVLLSDEQRADLDRRYAADYTATLDRGER
jgi:hypothetical protein